MFKYIVIIISTFSLVGCVANIPLQKNILQNKNQRIVVVKAVVDKPDFFKMGQQGILDYAINDTITAPFRSYVQNNLQEVVSLNWYGELQQLLTQQLRAQYINARLIQKPISIDNLPVFGNGGAGAFAFKNYTLLSSQLNADKMLLIHIDGMGAVRYYYGFIPLGAPKAYCEVVGELIDLKSNCICWRYRAAVERPISGCWDQPPAYPNFTMSFKVAVETAKQQVLTEFQHALETS